MKPWGVVLIILAVVYFGIALYGDWRDNQERNRERENIVETIRTCKYRNNENSESLWIWQAIDGLECTPTMMYEGIEWFLVSAYRKDIDGYDEEITDETKNL